MEVGSCVKCAETFSACGCGSKAAERYEAYEDPITDRQEYKIDELGGKSDEDMTRSEASDYIKKLQGRESGTWRAESGPLPPDPRVSPLNTGLYSPSDSPEMAAEMKDSHLTVSQRVLRAVHDQYPALYENIEEGTQFPPEELEDTGDYDDAVDIAETMQLVRLLSADIRNASEPIKDFYDITKTYPRGVENEMYAESYAYFNKGGLEFRTVGMCGCEQDELWKVVNVESPVFLCGTCGYAGNKKEDGHFMHMKNIYDAESFGADDYDGNKEWLENSPSQLPKAFLEILSDEDEYDDVLVDDLTYCPRCDANPNDNQPAEQQKWESDHVKEHGVCHICMEDLIDEGGEEVALQFDEGTFSFNAESFDTEKYEGHTKGDDEIEGGWRIIGDNFVLNDFTSTAPNMRYIAYVNYGEDETWKVFPFSDADAQLIADAPLLLAKVKELQAKLNAESFGAESKFDKLAKEIAEEYEEKGKSPKEAMEIGEATAAKIGRAKFGKRKFAKMGKKAENDIDFDEAKADRNKDGRISDWERAVGNAVAKGIRESKRAEVGPHVPTRIAATTTPRGVVKTFDSIPAGDGHVIGQFTPDMDYAPSGMYGAESLTSSIEKGFGAVLGIMSGLIVGGFAMGAVSSLSKDDENRE